MFSYSIAIRTLGTAGEKFRRELESITQQTIQPERVLVYIAEGYPHPGFTVGKEEYVWVKKGMVAQRVLPYNEIGSDCILMLDDDVELASDSAERMLKAMEENNADCVGADTFRNQDMKLRSKFYAMITNLVFPHYSKKWAFKIHRNGSFSYNNCPAKSFYWSQSCAGPASFWRKEVYHRLRLGDELWLDGLEFAFGDDVLEFYKLYKNGFRLGILYDAGVVHLDEGSSSSRFKKSPQRMYIRSKASFIIWWRTCFRPGDTCVWEQTLTAFCFFFKAVWLFGVMCGVGLVTRNRNFIVQYLKGMKDGWSFVHSAEYRNIGSYIVKS